MTRTTHIRTVAGARRLAVVAAVTAAVFGSSLTVLGGHPAQASGLSTTSSVIAGQAAGAVDLLERWRATGSVADYSDYMRARSRVATLTGAELGVDPSVVQQAWSGVSLGKQHVVLSAISQLGVPYRSRTSQEDRGFDCSGLVLYAYSRAGFELPRTSSAQFRFGDEIAALEAEAGDLVYYPGHISLYIGAGLMVHSPNSGEHVEVRPLFDRSLRFADTVEAAAESDDDA